MTDRRTTAKIVIHCAATRPPGDAKIGAAEIDRWHKERGWSGIGYHYVIRRSGRVELGRPLRATGAHARGHNHESVGVCLVGGLDAAGNAADEYTDEQWVSLQTVVEFLQLVYPSAEVLGHRDLPDVNKACPSFDVKEWMLT